MSSAQTSSQPVLFATGTFFAVMLLLFGILNTLTPGQQSFQTASVSANATCQVAPTQSPIYANQQIIFETYGNQLLEDGELTVSIQGPTSSTTTQRFQGGYPEFSTTFMEPGDYTINIQLRPDYDQLQTVTCAMQLIVE